MIHGHTRRSLLVLFSGAAIALATGCGRASPPTGQPEPERVSVGYGTVDREDLTGAVASVRVEEAEGSRHGNVEELLRGRVSGVQVKQTSGGLSIRIRGTSRLTGDEEPLFVVDGVPVRLGPGRDLMLNPLDVERIEVLKDVSSTAIYGSRGAHGVILITTRRAR